MDERGDPMVFPFGTGRSLSIELEASIVKFRTASINPIRAKNNTFAVNNH